jgi:hypothetical protein
MQTLATFENQMMEKGGKLWLSSTPNDVHKTQPKTGSSF